MFPIILKLPFRFKTLADLDPEETYEFRAIAEVLVEATSNTGSATTSEAPNLQVNRVNIIGAAYSNGMLNAIGNPLPEGDIVSATGRTFAGQFNVTTWHQANARTRSVDAVRFLLWNQRNVPISGGKLIVGWSDDNPGIMGQGNNPTQVYNEPSVGGTRYNSVTGNARQGWKRATIGGNPLLPVPAADATKEGAAWTDWIEFNALVLDFNRAENPPCGLVPHVACPMALPENRLDLAVTAGEKKYAGPH